MSNLTHPPRNTSATGLPLRKKFLFTLIPFLIFFGSAEAVLRMTVGLDQIRYKCHYPILDNQYCPNVEAIQKLTGAVIRSNAEGLLDKEYSKARTPGTFRVAVLGDSFTAGEEVKDGFEFHALWEKELTRRLGRPVEFINFGVAGIGPWKELQTYHLRARAYHPDLTLLAFYWENDVDNAISKLKSGGPNPLLEEYPVTSWWEQAKVVRKRFNQWLWNNLAIYQFTHTRYRILEHQFHLTFRPEWRKDPEEFLPENKPADASPEVEEDAPANPQPENAGRIDNEFLQTYPPLPGIPPMPRPATDTPTARDDHWFFDSEGWVLVKKLLLKLQAEVEADGGGLAVMHFMGETPYARRFPLPVGEFNTFLRENGIRGINPNPAFWKMSKEQLHAQYVPGDTHFNEQGNAVLAATTMDEMEAIIRREIKNRAHPVSG